MTSLRIEPHVLNVILGSQYTIDAPKLSVQSREEALQFIFTYGYELSDYKDQEQLWRIHRKSIEILEEEILDVGDEIPLKVRNREELKDLTDLLLMASYADGSRVQQYACAILRLMHLIIQLENDLFTSFTDDIQYQILRPIQEHIFSGEKDTFYLGEDKGIKLADFSIKPFKQTRSAIIKLLAKDNVLAMTLLDRVGVRFVTESTYDIFRVIQYLVEKHLISVPHTLSGQSKNLICPSEVFFQAEETMVHQGKSPVERAVEFEETLNQKLKAWEAQGNSLESTNRHSSEEFKFLKFISRRFLKIPRGEGKDPLKFFYPFEVQIVDKKSHKKNQSFEGNHTAYKERQRRMAKRRLLGFES